ncbi:diguanylate cyclase [uncultured Pelagimonas sp.]|uniref:sensor domain-containing diguanylate cyclase n=1 Tax=uncultured Pelagimonas sp. TaxID=1618102 RepID=UPI00262C9F34|nr:diguanylate cyclase [uncultured Pelagimonas sp.]
MPNDLPNLKMDGPLRNGRTGMIAPPLANEAERLEYLDWLQLIRSPRTPEFDAITALAADILDCPIALVSIVGQDEQWFKSKHGLDADTTSRDVSFCAHAMHGDEVFVVEDAHQDDRFRDNPLVTGDPNIRFYAGYPISTDGVTKLGSFCVIDRKPRVLTEKQEQQLKLLGIAVEGLLRTFESERMAIDAAKTVNDKAKLAHRTASLLDRITEVSGVGGWELSLETQTLFWTDQTKRIHDVPLDYDPSLETALAFYEPESADMISAVVGEAIENKIDWDVEAELTTAKGRKIWVHTVGTPLIEDGKVTGLIGTFRDITDRKEFEHKIQKSEAIAKKTSMELRTILDRMEQGVSVFDSDSRLTTWNDNYIEIFNKPEHEIRYGVTLQELLEAEAKRGDFKPDVHEHLERLYSQLALGEPVSAEFRLGNGRIIATTHAPMPDGGWVGTHTDITERANAEEKVRHASLHDALTGLPNRLKLEEDFNTWTKDALAHGDEIALVMLDLNKFKNINDTHGHHVGDKLLQKVSDRLCASVRTGDLVARLGGDEFAILLKCSPEDAVIVLERLAKVIVETLTQPFEIEGKHLEIGCSVGISLAQATDYDYERQMQQSDVAMYKVKRSGQSGFGFYRPH